MRVEQLRSVGAGQDTKGLAIQHTGLAEGLDRRRPGPAVVAVAILDLRAKAKKRLGARFDIRAFHEVVLAEGNLPLSILAKRVEGWIDAQLAK